MTDTIVIKKPCERCPQVDEVPITADDIKAGKMKPEPTDAPAKYEVKVGGKTHVTYRKLCFACEAAVTKAIDEIATKRQKKSRHRRDD